MGYNPNITHAKREAKKHARNTGSSYQAALEHIAHKAGAKDWASFLNDPRPIDGEIKAADYELGYAEGQNATNGIIAAKATISHNRIWLIGIITMMFIAVLWTSWEIWETNAQARALSVIYNDERAISPKIAIPEIMPDRDAYVAAWRIREDHRKLYLTYFDWRPVDFNFITKTISKIRLKLGYDIRYVSGSDENPVFRFHANLNCQTGKMERLGGFLAKDLVSDPVMRKSDGGKPIMLSPEKTAMLCSEDVLNRTKKLIEVTAEKNIAN